jgi:hypothetical protein
VGTYETPWEAVELLDGMIDCSEKWLTFVLSRSFCWNTAVVMVSLSCQAPDCKVVHSNTELTVPKCVSRLLSRLHAN